MTNTEAINDYMGRLAAVTVSEAEELGTLWAYDTPESPRGVARKFATRAVEANEDTDEHLWYVARDLLTGKGKWMAGWAAGDAVLALQARGFIPKEMYTTLIGPAVQVFGPIHPEDVA
jgi:hypothetical protein